MKMKAALLQMPSMGEKLKVSNFLLQSILEVFSTLYTVTLNLD